MPQPPAKNESKKKFISRCIKYNIEEGKTPEQAVSKCHGIWEQSQKKKTKSKSKWYSKL